MFIHVRFMCIIFKECLFILREKNTFLSNGYLMIDLLQFISCQQSAFFFFCIKFVNLEWNSLSLQSLSDLNFGFVCGGKHSKLKKALSLQGNIQVYWGVCVWWNLGYFKTGVKWNEIFRRFLKLWCCWCVCFGVDGVWGSSFEL